MKFTHKFLLLIVFVCAQTITEAQVAKPYQIGIVVKNIDSAAAWYAHVFDMKIVKRMSFPEYDSLEILFLKNNEFGLELLKKSNSFSIHKYVPDYSANRAPQIGYYKTAFITNNLELFYSKFTNQKSNIVLPITEDNEFGTKYFIVKDLDNNVLQFIQQLN